MPLPLSGIKVIEFEGIGPAPLGCCILADYGADVVTVSRVSKGKARPQGDPVSRGKRSIALDVKSETGLAAVKRLVAKADVVVDPFRPMVMERLGLSPEVLCGINPRLIYARMTGWGQRGDPDYVKTAGHDNNYIALAGTLDLFRRGDERPFPPVNMAGDYAGGGVMMAMGVLLAVIERASSGKGQVIDVAMTDGANYVALPLFKWLQPGGLFQTDQDGHFDPSSSILNQTAPWSDIYLCEDGKYFSVQALEPQFYAEMLKCLDLSVEEDKLPDRSDVDAWPWMKARLQSIFITKTRDEWAEIFKGTDACGAPVLSAIEAARHPHNVARGSFAPTPEHPGLYEPAPAPQLSRTPGHRPRPKPTPAADTVAVLSEYGFSQAEIEALLRSKTAVSAAVTAKL